MARPGWQREIDNAKRHEVWSLRGSNRPVKVTGVSYYRNGLITSVRGYFTKAAFIANMTVPQIVAALGLKADDFSEGAFIYDLAHLPNASQYSYELTARYPDGLAYHPVFSHPDYPPGSDQIHQWKLADGVCIPVRLNNVVRLRHDDRFPG